LSLITNTKHRAFSKVKASVPLVIRGVPEEDTERGARVQLVRRSGSSVGVTSTPKHAEVIVPRRGTAMFKKTLLNVV
jgi:hypothetical protein